MQDETCRRQIDEVAAKFGSPESVLNEFEDYLLAVCARRFFRAKVN
jgi:hypothetical protein